MKPEISKKSSSLIKPSQKHPKSDGRCGPHPIIKELAKIPHQKPIFKEEYNGLRFHDNFRNHPINPEISSKYVGVSYDAVVNKWRAQMMIRGTVVHLGCYMNEEEAGSIYAKAAYKYKPRVSGGIVGIYGGLDLRSIPNQPLILRPDHETSIIKYKGVKKCKNRWQARVHYRRDKDYHLGTFDTIEEAAQVYANAVYYLEHKNESLRKAVEIVEGILRCPV